MVLSTVELGDGLSVSALGLGGMALTSVYGDVDPGEALATLNHAVDIGITFLDTANSYGDGANEELIARLLADRRDEVVVATKFGILNDPATGKRTSRGDPAYVRRCIDESLRRLQTDVVDLYYLHRLDPDTPLEETIGAMAELIDAGKVRHLGVSELTADELRRAHAVHPIAAIQSEWSVWSRDVEARVVPTASDLGIGFVPYSPLGRGFLAGTVTSRAGLAAADVRRRFPRFSDEAFEGNLAIADVIQDVARVTSSTPAQVALAWLLAQGARFGLPTVPIPGTRRAHRLDENAGAFELRIDDEQLARLNAVAAGVVGARSADPRWVSSGRESPTARPQRGTQ